MNYKNIEIFNDTLRFIKENKALSSSVTFSRDHTTIYKPYDYPKLDASDKDGQLVVSIKRSFEAAMDMRHKYPDSRIGVLNFASATNPGGGVTHGSSAQEESLCRISTLYPVLATDRLFNDYYKVNRDKRDNLHDDTVIYTPDIMICKTDTNNPIRLDERGFIHVDILSAAAPNLRIRPSNMYNADDDKQIIISDEELYKLHLSRAKHILSVAAAHNINILILGAFGCGAFMNNPYVVAKAYKDALKEYLRLFDIIEFAIYCSSYDKDNYNIFKETLLQ